MRGFIEEQKARCADSGGPLRTIPLPSVDAWEYRRVLGNFISGVTIVTGMHEDQPVGLACQSFSALSLDPPLVLFCVAKSSSTWPRIEAAGQFAVNVLSDHQVAVCKQFGRPGPDKFEGVAWQPAGRTGSPIIDGVVGWVECETEAVIEGGDHWIVTGRVVDLDAYPRDPLTFFRGSFNQEWREGAY
ncbi:flavin reductase family protein [Streptomyces brasiliensis]|uniref:Monooxygenase n=1 Tax=Streptomyces brasiliensis TaxID=1954 RepID=A0A917L3E3_9ACTN|nr:flavin reductase family protein [Streptomyces brasiliensis]GGJ42833.1 monooxygenase [Streptomyces brasiliensis]